MPRPIYGPTINAWKPLNRLCHGLPSLSFPTDKLQIYLRVANKAFWIPTEGTRKEVHWRRVDASGNPAHGHGSPLAKGAQACDLLILGIDGLLCAGRINIVSKVNEASGQQVFLTANIVESYLGVESRSGGWLAAALTLRTEYSAVHVYYLPP